MKPPFSNFSSVVWTENIILMRFQSETSVFKFLRRSVNGKHLMRFQSGETSVFKFLQRGVNGKHLMRFLSETSVFKFLRRSVDGKHLLRFQSENTVFKFLRHCTVPKTSEDILSEIKTSILLTDLQYITTNECFKNLVACQYTIP